LFFEAESFAKLHQNFIFISLQKGRIDSDNFQLLIRVILLKVLTTVYDNLTDQVMHYLLRSCEDKKTAVFTVEEGSIKALIHRPVRLRVKLFYAVPRHVSQLEN